MDICIICYLSEFCFCHSFNLDTKKLKSAYVSYIFIGHQYLKMMNDTYHALVTNFLWLSFLLLFPPFFLFFSKCDFLDSILKRRDITLPTKVHLVKPRVLPVVMYGCDSWTVKKAEHRRIDAFELWCWRRLLRVPWTSSRSN